MHVVAPEDKRVCCSLWNRNYGWLWTTKWELGTKPWCFSRTNALSRWAISLTPCGGVYQSSRNATKTPCQPNMGAHTGAHAWASSAWEEEVRGSGILNRRQSTQQVRGQPGMCEPCLRTKEKEKPINTLFWAPQTVASTQPCFCRTELRLHNIQSPSGPTSSAFMIHPRGGGKCTGKVASGLNMWKHHRRSPNSPA